MSPPQTNTFSYDSAVNTEYPVRFRFPVTWSSISAPLDREGAQSFDVVIASETQVRESHETDGAGGQWEMVIPKMSRPPARPAPMRIKPVEPAPAIPNPPQSTFNWILIALGAILLGLIVWILFRATTHVPASTIMTISEAVVC